MAHRLGATAIDIATANTGLPPTVIARHRLASDGAGVMVRDSGHVTALETAALAAFSTAAPHRRKPRIPPGPAARAAADQLRENTTDSGPVVIDLAAYDRAARGRNTLR